MPVCRHQQSPLPQLLYFCQSVVPRLLAKLLATPEAECRPALPNVNHQHNMSGTAAPSEEKRQFRPHVNQENR